ncbi:DUF4241 domain-containing protein [Nocardia sp. CDC159]|uniref:DUF4241 domain-containing protein n=1 Tax=Nocardia pulmonis TaxID=2951408 RepID=A0A9X2E6M1_9NOCA|nr:MULTISPECIES: DUF4241 domain-containing protein [Nocardia]MCM6775287.1 DUF4241 domain-containing protein [Nocardia pulmonis]MCM6787979.1 DUF4241 domain-containing protein [Nocardia sp. CDC159]
MREFLRTTSADDRASLDVRYCEGFADGTVIGRLDRELARTRDAAGAQYAVAVLSGERVVACLEIAWAARFARCWRIDGRGRRYQRVDYRELADGRLVVTAAEEWDYPRSDQPEFDRSEGHRCWRFSRGELHDREPRVPVERRFGDWAALCLLDDAELRELPDPDHTVTAPPPWHPTRPLRPHALTELFTPGTCFELAENLRATTGLHAAGELFLSTGRLTVTDPARLHDCDPRLTLPPGSYPVELSVLHFADAPTRVAAAKLVVSPAMPRTWEMALREDEDPALLDDHEFFGVGIDTGIAAFLDTDTAPTIRAALETALDAGRSDPADLGIPGLICFPSGTGDGTYPVWVGRDADHQICAVVADFLIVRQARPLQPVPAL